MKKMLHICILTCLGGLVIPAIGVAGKGYMGGAGTVAVPKEPTVVEPTETTPDTGGLPDTVEGPLNDKMADSGKLFGDLYVILRQQGIIGDKKLVPQTNTDGTPLVSATYPNEYFQNNDKGIQLLVETTNTADTPDKVIGGEPVLTVIDPGTTGNYSDYGWYAAEIGENADGSLIYGVAQSPYPAQCVQPIANYERWGDISSKTGLTKNRLPMVITYDATWNRSECAVGKLMAPPTVNSATGELSFDINAYFIEPCTDIDKDGTIDITPKCQWKDPVNDLVTYPDGVLWTDLIGEVSFGRLNIGRAPEAVLQAAFDEAIATINSPDTLAIKIDAAGRLLLQKNVYDELRVDPDTGEPLLLGTTWKAIDSPLENVALYVKLMQDGHLVTPADEREPIDRSKNGGIPIWKMLELEDGPADAALRPTIDIAKMQAQGLGSLVDVTPVTYLTYYQCVDAVGAVVPCMCWDSDPAQPELDKVLVTCDNVVDRKLFSTDNKNAEGELICPVSTDPDNPITCEGPFTGILTDSTSYMPDAADLNYTAAFLAAAADKTGHVNWDMVVYINSILGINKVVGYSEYEADGITPTADAIDYSKHPVYFNFRRESNIYNREGTFGSTGNRGEDGNVTVLQGPSPAWTETPVSILGATMPANFVETSAPDKTIFDDIGRDISNGFPNGAIASENILGFTQQSDDDLSVIRFIHTYQIPGLR